MKDKIFTIVDIETTGASSNAGRVIEIGVLRVEGGKVVQTFQSLVNPEQDIPEFITGMTGITDAAVARAPRFEQIASEVFDLFSDATFVAQNAPFDYGFLKSEYRRLGVDFTFPRLCTVRLSRSVFPEHRHHNLAALIERYKFSFQNRHRAFDDAAVLWQFLQMLEKVLTEEDLHWHLGRATSPVHVVPADAPVASFVYERDSQELEPEL